MTILYPDNFPDMESCIRLLVHNTEEGDVGKNVYNFLYDSCGESLSRDLDGNYTTAQFLGCAIQCSSCILYRHNSGTRQEHVRKFLAGESIDA